MSSRNNDEHEADKTLYSVQPITLGERYKLVRSLPNITRSIYHDSSAARHIKKAAVFSLNSIRHQNELLRIQNVFNCPELKPVLELCPAILEKPFSPYVCADWGITERFEQIEHHFTYLKNTFGNNTHLFFHKNSYPLFSFNSIENEHYTFEVFPGYQCEGSIGLRIVDSDRNEIYTTSIHLSGSDEPSITIGAIQGPNDTIDDRQKKIVTLTKTLHGLRPKALMVEAIYMFAHALNIKTIRGIRNNAHIYQSEKFSDAKRKSVHFDFDELWQEYQGTVESERFYRLPETPGRKVIEDLKSKKRSMYRKRYAWLDEIHEVTLERIQAVLIEPSTGRSIEYLENAA